MTADVREAKKRLRAAMLGKERALSETEIAATTGELTKALANFPACRRARKILAYLSLPGEADLDPFLKKALGEEKEIYVPVCLPDFRMEAGRLLDMAHFVKGTYGLRDLPPGYETVAPEELELALIPAVAVDGAGHRLGRGAGYYDRFLSRISIEKRVAVVWDFQLADTVPHEAHDLPVGAVITEKRSIVF